MTENEMKSFITTHLMKEEGVIAPADVDRRIAELASQCPAAYEAECPTDVAKAYKVLQITNKNVPANPAETQTGISEPVPQMTAQESKDIAKKLYNQKERVTVSRNSSIVKYVFDKPAPAELIQAGATGIIKKDSFQKVLDKISNGSYKVLADDEDCASTTNFETIKKAFEGDGKLEIYIGDLNKRPEAYIVKKGTVAGTDGETVLTREQLKDFLVLETQGWIVSGENAPSVIIKYVEPKANANATSVGATVKPGRTVIVDKNKAAAVEAGLFDISKEVTSESAKATVKSKLAFKVETNEVKANGDKKVRTIRVALETQLPVLKRKDAYVEALGTGEKSTNSNFTEMPTKEQLEKIQTAQKKAIWALKQECANSETSAERTAVLEEKLKDFLADGNKGPAGNF